MILTRGMDALGRTLISALFLLAALNKFVNTPAILHHMEEQHAPDYFLPLVVTLEVCAELAALLGWQVRWAALAGFCVATAVLIHMVFSGARESALFT